MTSPQIGINPGLLSAHLGHHYCNANNHFCTFGALLSSDSMTNVFPRAIFNTQGHVCTSLDLFPGNSHIKRMPNVWSMGLVSQTLFPVLPEVAMTSPGSCIEHYLIDVGCVHACTCINIRKEIKEWSGVMTERMKELRPLVACFNGKGVCICMCILSISFNCFSIFVYSKRNI